MEMVEEGRPKEQQEDRANAVVTRNGGVETEGVSNEQVILGSGGQYEGGAVDEELEGGGWEVGGNFSDDLFEKPIMRRRSTRREWREERKSYGLVRAKNLPRTSWNTPTDGLPATPQELSQLQESD